MMFDCFIFPSTWSFPSLQVFRCILDLIVLFLPLILFWEFSLSARMSTVKEGRRWPGCIHIGVTVRVFCETSLPFCFVLPGLKSSLVYIIFRTPMQSSWSHTPPPVLWTWIRPLTSMPPTQLTRHFHWGNASILFTLINRSASCCFFLLPAPDFTIMPPTQFTWHFRKGISVLFTWGNRSISCYAPMQFIKKCLQVIFQLWSGRSRFFLWFLIPPVFFLAFGDRSKSINNNYHYHPQVPHYYNLLYECHIIAFPSNLRDVVKNNSGMIDKGRVKIQIPSDEKQWEYFLLAVNSNVRMNIFKNWGKLRFIKERDFSL